MVVLYPLQREARLRADNEAMKLELAHLRSLIESREGDTAETDLNKSTSGLMSTSGSSFLTTEDGMDVEEGPLSLSHDTADRRMSKAAASALKAASSDVQHDVSFFLEYR